MPNDVQIMAEFWGYMDELLVLKGINELSDFQRKLWIHGNKTIQKSKSWTSRW